MTENYQHIEISQQQEIVYIRLNRPEKQNALLPLLINELNNAFLDLQQNNTCRFVVLSGNGKSFCAGADLEWFAKSTNRNKKENIQDYKALANMLLTFHQLPQISIALVHGNIFGGGIGLMAAADFVLMEDTSLISFSEIKLGILPATIMPFVANRISMQQAKRKMLTGQRFSAQEAWNIGLADFLVNEGKLSYNLKAWLGELSKGEKQAQTACKHLIHKVYANEIGVYNSEATAEILSKRLQANEAKKRITAFLKQK